ncbi:uncharacterized protein TEOVI_000254800 [Trypanosoma equiperdum]|nr:hypothetical protein, conserved [Trypanosoma equiperdum]
MDFDTSTTSVTSAMLEAQQKINSLREDKELYATLEAKASANFERHRSELTLLLQKERAIHAAAEDRLRAQLQQLLQENEAAQAELQCVRAERDNRCCEEVQRQRQQREQHEETMRREALELRDALAVIRDDVEVAQKEKHWHEMQLHEALTLQQALHADFRKVRQEADELSATELQKGQPQKSGREKVFLPCGPADKTCPVKPASHHIAAIVSTVERNNYYWPRLYYRRRGIPSPLDSRRESAPRCRSNSSNPAVDIHRNSSIEPCQATQLVASPILPKPATAVPATTASLSITPVTALAADTSATSTVAAKVDPPVTYSARNLDAICRSLLREILQMRKEYQECTAALNDPTSDTVELSRRMRNLMCTLDRKVHQLRSLRQQQAKVEDKLRMHDMLMEIAEENNYCRSVYSDLLELIRS